MCGAINVDFIAVQRLPRPLRILTCGEARLFRFCELRRACSCHIDSFGMNVVFTVQTESKLRLFNEVPQGTRWIFFNVTNRIYS